MDGQTTGVKKAASRAAFQKVPATTGFFTTLASIMMNGIHYAQ